MDRAADPAQKCFGRRPENNVNDIAHSDERLTLAQAWLTSLPAAFGLRPDSLRPASSDASFRRYFRVDAGDATLIVMDAPPPQEDCRPFVRVAALLAREGVHTPEVVASDLGRGLLLLSDLGSTTYSDALARGGANVEDLYGDALAALLRLQGSDATDAVPPYDATRLLTEMRLFSDWYVARHLGITLSPKDAEVLERAYARLCDAALAQGSLNHVVLPGVEISHRFL